MTLLPRAPRILTGDPNSSSLCMERMLTENEAAAHLTGEAGEKTEVGNLHKCEGLNEVFLSTSGSGTSEPDRTGLGRGLATCELSKHHLEAEVHLSHRAARSGWGALTCRHCLTLTRLNEEEEQEPREAGRAEPFSSS